ncbi:hypothetical protein C8F04DRAFT_1274244 [Mycena alexandri]|uniref:Uncharacterized protein n=1 Tax=Mycena alexandri TaxID=1745969 RepID=A0AAD6S4E4_9AGAR|nr:hypothetical protein C8F04DRAFT_1274244 [Mycena alexandri]
MSDYYSSTALHKGEPYANLNYIFFSLYIMGSASSPPPTTEEDEDDDPMPGLILMGDAADCCSCRCKIHALAKIRAKL